MKSKSIYIGSTEDAKVMLRAAKLLKFHEDISLSQYILQVCRGVVEKYDGKEGGK